MPVKARNFILGVPNLGRQEARLPFACIIHTVGVVIHLKFRNGRFPLFYGAIHRFNDRKTN